ncbi:MAG: hypothetical protein U1F48_13665 [Burkholderiales bacterium]
MTPLTRNVVAMLAMFIAATAVQPRADAAEPPRGAKGAQAEVQIGLCAPTVQIVRALDLRPHGGPITVWQFDDPVLTLFGRGLRLRLRVDAGGHSVLTLKVADQDCARLGTELIPPGEGKCEFDVYGKNMAGAVSLDLRLDRKSTNDLLAGRLKPAQVLSASQVKYLREVVGTWPLPSGIRKLGPMKVQTYRTKGKLDDIDISQLPGGEQFAEISRKVPLEDALRTMGVMQAELSQSGVEVCADQSSQAGNKLRSLLR